MDLARLETLDEELVRMLAKRAELVARLPEAAGRSLDAVWRAWEQGLPEPRFDPAIRQGLFSLANRLGGKGSRERPDDRDGRDGREAAASRESSADAKQREGYRLSARPGELKIELPGPADELEVTATAFLAAMTGQPFRLDEVILGDELFDFGKALNQLGGRLAWGAGFIQAEPADPIRLHEGFAACGRSAFAAYLLLCAGLADGASVKLTGALALEGLDLLPAAEIMAKMDARPRFLQNKTRGLPVRLEAVGWPGGSVTVSQAELDALPDHGFLMALGLNGWTFPEGLRLAYPAGPANAALDLALARVAALLRRHGIAAVAAPGQLTVPAGRPTVARKPDAPIDPLRAGWLAALVRSRGGFAVLSGNLDKADPAAAALPDLLRAAGLRTRAESAALRIEAGPPPSDAVLAPVDPRYLLLAATLAASLPSGATVRLPDGTTRADLAHATETLEAFGAPYSREADALRVTGLARLVPGGPWTAPAPDAGLAAAAFGLRMPGVTLANSKDLSSWWPGFLHVFSKLPDANPDSLKPFTPPSKEAPRGDAKPRRRIRT